MNIVFLIIFILFVMIIKLIVSQCSLLSYSICLGAGKICVVFVVEVNLKVIPVKYGWELTHTHSL